MLSRCRAAPFTGAALSVPLLGDRVGVGETGAAVLMATGVWLLLRDRHSHVHTHEPLEHDQHHRHRHGGSDS